MGRKMDKEELFWVSVAIAAIIVSVVLPRC